ncbi:MAG: hypothetical protein IAE82_17935 [Opitutaceae bacterium]|nr:hypothetical protein [Opitutaceae bacterium]
MKRPVHDTHGPADPEPWLARGLRGTTPEFEARFDDLRRRLAQEPARRTIAATLASALRMRAAWLGVATAAAVLALAFVVTRTRTPRGVVPDGAEEQWYAETVALDESLRGALVLADGEAREVVSLMSVETPGGDS